MNTREFELVRRLYAADVGLLFDRLGEIEHGLAEQFAETRRDRDVKALDGLLAGLRGAEHAVVRLRLALVQEGER